MSQTIEGLPPGVRVKRVKVGTLEHDGFMGFVELEPDNVYGVLDLAAIKIPAGFEREASDWFREPHEVDGVIETWLHPADMQPIEKAFCLSSTLYSFLGDRRRIILRKLQRINVYGVYDLMEVKIPDGYERAGTLLHEWFRVPVPGEWFIGSHSKPWLENGLTTVESLGPFRERIILRKVKPPKPRVLVFEFPIFELRKSAERLESPLPETLDILHISCVTSGFAERIASFLGAVDPRRCRIEEREG